MPVGHYNDTGMMSHVNVSSGDEITLTVKIAVSSTGTSRSGRMIDVAIDMLESDADPSTLKLHYLDLLTRVRDYNDYERVFL